MFATHAIFTTTLLLSIATACKRDEPKSMVREGTARPLSPAAAVSASTGSAAGTSTATGGPAISACAGGGGPVVDPIAQHFFPQKIADYCVDPQAEVRTYGENAKFTMDKVCTTAFDGECEVYKAFGLQRVVSLHYIADKSSGIVDVVLSRFVKDGAYAMFTKRVVADGDPNLPTTPRAFDPATTGAIVGAIGTGRAYVWRGDYLVELQYNNEEQAPRDVKKSSDAILPLMAAAIGAQLPLRGKSDNEDLPASVRALPTLERVVNGVQFYPREAPLFGRVGATAIGFYRAGDRRYQAAAITREDEASAKDAMKTLRSRPGATKVEYLADDAWAVSFVHKDGELRSEWVFARKGAQIVGFGDDEFALRAEDTTAKRDAVRLGTESASTRLKALFALSAPVAPK
jgi:hypothetical protein